MREFGFTIPGRALVVDDVRVRATASGTPVVARAVCGRGFGQGGVWKRVGRCPPPPPFIFICCLLLHVPIALQQTWSWHPTSRSPISRACRCPCRLSLATLKVLARVRLALFFAASEKNWTKVNSIVYIGCSGYELVECSLRRTMRAANPYHDQAYVSQPPRAGRYQDTGIFVLEDLGFGQEVAGPAILMDKNTTVLVCEITRLEWSCVYASI